jgi:hypothetical protein
MAIDENGKKLIMKITALNRNLEGKRRIWTSIPTLNLSINTTKNSVNF